MRIVLFGAKGQLGRDLLRVMGDEHDITGLDRPEVDITAIDIEALLTDTKPDIVINAAAYTDVEAAEDHRTEAYGVNERGAESVGRATAKLDIPVLYYSTDFVFDGEKDTPYEPEDFATPLSVYGDSKAAGEAATRLSNPKYFIVRTAWLYGPGGNNFVEKMLHLARTHDTLQVVEDEIGSPTHTWDLAQATVALLQTQQYGIYHAVNAGACSRYEFAKAIFEMADVSADVVPCTSDTFPTKARRPHHCVLSTETLEQATGYSMRPWREALKHYLERRSTDL